MKISLKPLSRFRGPLLMSTSGAAKPSCWKGKGSNERPSNTGACNIATPLPNIINQVSQSLRYFRPHPVSNHLTTDSLSVTHYVELGNGAVMRDLATDFQTKRINHCRAR